MAQCKQHKDRTGTHEYLGDMWCKQCIDEINVLMDGYDRRGKPDPLNLYDGSPAGQRSHMKRGTGYCR